MVLYHSPSAPLHTLSSSQCSPAIDIQLQSTQCPAVQFSSPTPNMVLQSSSSHNLSTHSTHGPPVMVFLGALHMESSTYGFPDTQHTCCSTTVLHSHSTYATPASVLQPHCIPNFPAIVLQPYPTFIPPATVLQPHHLSSPPAMSHNHTSNRSTRHNHTDIVLQSTPHTFLQPWSSRSNAHIVLEPWFLISTTLMGFQQHSKYGYPTTVIQPTPHTTVMVLKSNSTHVLQPLLQPHSTPWPPASSLHPHPTHDPPALVIQTHSTHNPPVTDLQLLSTHGPQTMALKPH